MAGPISLEIVTPLGRVEGRSGIDELVVRRREMRFEIGSEIAIFPGHAPMLVRVPESDIRYVSMGRTRFVHVGPGFVEVWGDHVTALVPFARHLAGAPARPCG